MLCRRRRLRRIEKVTVETGVVVVESVVQAVPVGQFDPDLVSGVERNDSGIRRRPGTLTGRRTAAAAAAPAGPAGGRRLRTARAARIVEGRQETLAVAYEVQEDALTVEADAAEAEQVRAVERGGKDARRDVVTLSAVR